MSMKLGDAMNIAKTAYDQLYAEIPEDIVTHLSECVDDDIDVIARAIMAAVEDEREACSVALEAMAKTYLPGGPMDAKGGLMMGAAAIRNRQSKDG